MLSTPGACIEVSMTVKQTLFLSFGIILMSTNFKGRFVCNEYIANKKYLPCKKANRDVQASPLQLALGADETPRPRCRNVAKLVCSRECGWVALLSEQPPLVSHMAISQFPAFGSRLVKRLRCRC